MTTDPRLNALLDVLNDDRPNYPDLLPLLIMAFTVIAAVAYLVKAFT